MNLDREMTALLERDYRRGRVGFELDEGSEAGVADDPFTARLRDGILELRCWGDDELLEFQVPTPSQVRAKWFIPKGIETVSHKTPVGLYIVSWEQHGIVYGVAFSGNRKKPDWNYNFGKISGRGPDALKKMVKRTVATFKASQNTKVAAATEKSSFEHKYIVGDILYSSWGYDQTNVDFYQVVKITRKSIKIRKIAQDITPGRGQDSVMPLKGQFVGQMTGAKRVRPSSDGRGSIKISSYSGASFWDGRPMRQTSPGYGH